MTFSGKTVAFHTLGCKLNYAETSAIARSMEQKGFVKRSFDEAADVYVINTCSVTSNADRECRSIVRNALALNPEAFVAVIGCYAQLKPEEIASIEGVDIVLGASEKFRLPEFIDFTEGTSRAKVHNCGILEADFFVGAYSSGDRTRSFLKVQDGCDYTCTFCTIPLARGASRSDTIENIVAGAEKIAQSGVKEIVLTGVNIGDFGYGVKLDNSGRKTRKNTFLDLIRELDKVKGIDRFRISSIEPNLLKDEIISFVAGSRRFAPHFHLPLQSGSDAILKKMKRRYNTSLYRERVETIRRLIPQCCIGVDVITGFPGETEVNFMETYEFLNSLPVSYLHVFTYSERENTPAANMDNPVPAPVRKKRTKALRSLSIQKLTEFYNSQKGRKLDVIFESENKNGFVQGYSENYVRIKTPYEEWLVNSLTKVIAGEIGNDGSMLCALPESYSVVAG